MQEWFKTHAFQILAFALTAGVLYSNVDTRLAYAERMIQQSATDSREAVNFNQALIGRLSVVETELKANTRMIEQVYGYIKATNQNPSKVMP